jgi:hypothetical protein
LEGTVYLHQSLKIKKKKKSQNSRNPGFLLLFPVDGSICIRIRKNNDGSGSRRPEKYADSDPQHCFIVLIRSAEMVVTNKGSRYSIRRV